MISTTSSLCHYTSFEVLTHILNEDTLKTKNMSFWFSNPLQTNDKKEVRFFEEYIFKNKNGKSLQSKIDKLKNNIGNPYTLSLIHHKIEKKSYPPCEIPMWRMYGDNFKGLRLVFKYGKLKQFCQNNGLSLLECKYLTKSDMNILAREIRQVMSSSNFLDSSIETLYKEAVCYKTYDWVYEKEWRIVKWTNDIVNIGYRPANGRLYYPIKIPLDLLETIVIGPKADQEAIEGSLNLIKKKLGDMPENHFKIVKSKLQIGYV